MRKVWIFLAVLILASSVQAQRRRAVGVSGPPWIFQGTVQVVDWVDDTGLTRVGVVGSVFSFLPAGTSIETQVLKPDGSIYQPFSRPGSLLYQGGTSLLAFFANEPFLFPSDYPPGVTTFKMVVTIPNRGTFTALQTVSFGDRSVAPAPIGGPLQEAIVDASGGILLIGAFTTIPVVESPEWWHVMLPVEGGNYIPPGTIWGGQKHLTVCSGIGGDPNNLYCSTTLVNLPKENPAGSSSLKSTSN
jgi:hypothetical protein